MKHVQEYLDKLKLSAPYFRQEFGVRSMRIFGSVARGEDREDSDIDIFVEMPPKAFKMVELKQYLQKLLGRAVDLVRAHSNLDPFLTNSIQRDGIVVFGN